MKDKIFIIWPDIDNEISWPSIWLKNLLDGFSENNIKFEIVKWFKPKELIKLIKLPFYNNIYLNWIVNHKIIYFLSKIFPYKKFIIWPDFKHNNKIFDLKNCFYLVPWSWTKRYVRENYRITDEKINVFKLPIWNKYLNSISTKKWPIIIYYKNLKYTNETSETRENKKLIFENIKKYFEENKIQYITFIYWEYNIDDWFKWLENSKLVICITWTEWWPIAKSEIMSFDIPNLNYKQNVRVFVHNQVRVDYWSTLPDVPEDIYWKDFTDLNSFIEWYNYIIKNYNNYNPKKFILETSTPKIMAKKLFDFYSQF